MILTKKNSFRHFSYLLHFLSNFCCFVYSHDVYLDATMWFHWVPYSKTFFHVQLNSTSFLKLIWCYHRWIFFFFLFLFHSLNLLSWTLNINVANGRNYWMHFLHSWELLKKMWNLIAKCLYLIYESWYDEYTQQMHKLNEMRQRSEREREERETKLKLFI